jgi:hypothetical protein
MVILRQPIFVSSPYRAADCVALCAGAIGAEWLKAFKGYMENPTTMLL